MPKLTLKNMAEPTSTIPHEQTIVDKTKDLAAAIEQKVVDKFGLDPAKKSVEQRLTDEYGTFASEKSLKQIFRDKLSSDAENCSTGEKVHRASLAMQDVVHRAAQESVAEGEKVVLDMIKIAEADELEALAAAASRKLDPNAA